MREFCLTEEVMQQFVDGELSTEQTESAAAHLAACDACARLLDEVEQGNALLTEAFAPEMSLSVPTVRLRERLDAAIAELEPRALKGEAANSHRLRNWFGSLFGSLSFTPQQAFGFASIAVVIAFAAIFAVIQLRRANDTQTVADNKVVQPKAEPSPEPVAKGGSEEPEAPIVTPDSTPEVVSTVNNTTPRRSPVRRPGKATVVSQPPSTTQPDNVANNVAPSKLLPGEKGYLEAIASLTTAIDTNKDDVLKPAVRADYERNLAVVDQAIASTRQQVKRNPNDRDAAEFMYTAYQNKIELLSAVADQTRIASR